MTTRRVTVVLTIWLWCIAAIVGVFLPESIAVVLYMVLGISVLTLIVIVLIVTTIVWVLDTDDDDKRVQS